VWTVTCGLVAWVYWLAGSGMNEKEEEENRQDGKTSPREFNPVLLHRSALS
jgi:hypothetical protein